MYISPANTLNAIQNISIMAVTYLDDFQKRMQTLTKLTFPSFFPVKSPKKIKNSIVRELTDIEIKNLIKVTKIWHSFAKNKGDEFAKAKFQREILYENPFFHAYHINLDIKNFLKRKKINPNDPSQRVFACFVKNNIEAIAIAKKGNNESSPSYLYITYLATHPKNIRSILNNEESNRVSGAASSIISYLIEVCNKEKIETLRLFSVATAIEFYNKIGFKPEILGSHSMILDIKEQRDTMK
jgi:hypothetical protein